MSNEKDQKEIIKRISAVILREVAPEELILSDMYVDDYFASDMKINKPKAGSDIPLGFGNIDLVVVILIPVILTALNKITESITNSAVDKIKKAITEKSNKKGKSDILVDLQIIEVEKQLNITLSGSKLTRKKARKISEMILALIAEEL